MTSGRTNRISRLACVAALTSAASIAIGMAAGPASAAEDHDGHGEHALAASLSEPAPVAPGGSGVLVYKFRNVSDGPTKGILLNVALPEHVSLDPDSHCRPTGDNPEGGTLISCSFTDAQGKLGPGEEREARTPFHVAPDAPADADLGRLGALIVPLDGHGQPTEDWSDLDGANTVWTSIRTASDSSMAAWVKSWFS